MNFLIITFRFTFRHRAGCSLTAIFAAVFAAAVTSAPVTLMTFLSLGVASRSRLLSVRTILNGIAFRAFSKLDFFQHVWTQITCALTHVRSIVWRLAFNMANCSILQKTENIIDINNEVRSYVDGSFLRMIMNFGFITNNLIRIYKYKLTQDTDIKNIL